MSAIFDGPDGCYRLERDVELDLLGRNQPLVAALLGVNPALAGAVTNDQTIRKDIGFARVHGWRRIIKGNLCAYVAQDVRELASAPDPIGPDNDEHLEQIMRDADIVVPCWGPTAKLPRHLRNRWRDVAAIADRLGKRLYCLGTAKDGQPRHTLMLPYSAQLQTWERPQ